MTAPCPLYAFLVEFEVDASLSAAASDSLWSDFMKCADRHGLDPDGGRGVRLWTYRLTSESGQASEQDRAAISDWASKRREIVSVRVGELFDLRAT